jgi:hypothetical protein
MSRFYTGIGSRETPRDVLDRMIAFAVKAATIGLILRSGGAPGADMAFENGCAGLAEIYLPWRRFQQNPSPLFPPSEAAIAIAAQFHPAWHKCSRPARLLHGRNSHQILGRDLATPSEFVVCWTKDGLRGGGTGQALRIAEHFGIPIYDLAITDPPAL